MSRAQLVDERLDEETTEQLESQEAEQAEEVAQEDDLPEKYQGKSLKDIVQMHQEAEKLLGKQSSEVGDLRKVVDEYIQTQLANQAPVKQEEDEPVDFFSEPDKAIDKKIENHPMVREAQQQALDYRRQTAMSTLQSKHPDMQEVLNNPEFAKWIEGSKVRTRLFVEADKNYDYDAADELFTLWKERSNVAKQTVAVEQKARKQQLKAANTGNMQGTGQKARKKIYRRTDVIRLMKEDPERYMANADEFLQAYAEGRVR